MNSRLAAQGCGETACEALATARTLLSASHEGLRRGVPQGPQRPLANHDPSRAAEASLDTPVDAHGAAQRHAVFARSQLGFDGARHDGRQRHTAVSSTGSPGRRPYKASSRRRTTRTRRRGEHWSSRSRWSCAQFSGWLGCGQAEHALYRRAGTAPDKRGFRPPLTPSTRGCAPWAF